PSGRCQLPRRFWNCALLAASTEFAALAKTIGFVASGTLLDLEFHHHIPTSKGAAIAITATTVKRKRPRLDPACVMTGFVFRFFLERLLIFLRLSPPTAQSPVRSR